MPITTWQELLPEAIHTIVYYDGPQLWLGYREKQPVLIIAVAEDRGDDGTWTLVWIEFTLKPEDVRELAAGGANPPEAPYNVLLRRLDAFHLTAKVADRKLVHAARTPATGSQRALALYPPPDGDPYDLQPGWMSEDLPEGWVEPFIEGTALPPPPV